VVPPLALGVVPPAYLYVFIIAKNWRRGKTIRFRRAFFFWKGKNQEAGDFFCFSV
jgi:hypothetical protein